MRSKGLEKLVLCGALAAGLGACAGTKSYQDIGYGFCSRKTSDVLSMCIKDYPKMLLYYNRVDGEPTECKMVFEDEDNLTSANLSCRVRPESCRMMMGYKEDSRSLLLIDNYCDGSVDSYIETSSEGIEVSVKRDDTNEDEFEREFDPMFNNLSDELWEMTIPICSENK